MPLNVGDKVEVTIERLSYDGGRGVGRLSEGGLVIFVPLSAPGDRVLARIVELHKTFAVATIESLISPSSQRVEPQCPVFGRCGGCRWQHVTYAEQLTQKAAMIEFALKKTYVKPVTVIGSAKTYRYRNRIQLHKRGLEVGYYADSSHELVPIQDCPIADEQLSSLISTLAADSNRADGKYELAHNTDGVALRDLKSELSEFSQVNDVQNQKMKELIFERLEGEHFSTVYDLYCGDGNFTFPLAYYFKQTPIWGVEAHAPAIVRADAKARAARLDRLQFRAQDVKEFLKRLDFKENALMVFDPPRAGLGSPVIKEVLRLAPAKILYISCNLSTLARDLQSFANDYSVDEVIGIDMFPQTEHVETLSFLSRL